MYYVFGRFIFPSELIVIVLFCFFKETKIESFNTYLILSRFDAEVQESLPPGQEVLVLSTTSNLGGSSGGGPQPDTFQLLIESEDFSIDPYTGLISTKLRLDREKASYHLLVVGLKGGQGSGEPSDTATVNITVVDINDNDPAFTDSCKDLSLPENYQV